MLMDTDYKKVKWMKVAFREAEKAFESEEVPIGAVIIKDGKIIGCEIGDQFVFDKGNFDHSSSICPTMNSQLIL